MLDNLRFVVWLQFLGKSQVENWENGRKNYFIPSVWLLKTHKTGTSSKFWIGLFWEPEIICQNKLFIFLWMISEALNRIMSVSFCHYHSVLYFLRSLIYKVLHLFSECIRASTEMQSEFSKVLISICDSSHTFPIVNF